MIAFTNRAGRKVGSRNRLVAAPLGVAISGAATSAASVNVRTGVRPMSGLWVYVPGEGFVRWQDLEAQVAEAYLQWRRKKSMEGVLILDGEERKHLEIREGGEAGRSRREWMKEWRARHAALCRIAEIREEAA